MGPSCCLLLAASLALAPAPGDVPANDAWVTDTAGIVSAAMEQRLELLMESYRSGSTHEIALLTVPSLEGDSLEGFSLKVARAWGLGGKDAHNGALLLVVSGERKLRIEVGRGLEGTLTDSISGRIMRDVIAQRFRQGQVDQGLLEGISAIHAAIGGDYAPVRGSSRGRRSSGGGIMGLVLLMLLFGGFGGRGGRGRGWLMPMLFMGALSGGRHRGGGFLGSSGGLGGGGGFGGFGGGGGFSGGGASGGW